MSLCPVCNMVVTMADDHNLVPVEIPYMNLLYHLECWRTIEYEVNIDDIVHKHVEIEYNRDKDGDNNNGKKEKNTQLKSVQGHVRRRV
jgi:hypothetical protein